MSARERDHQSRNARLQSSEIIRPAAGYYHDRRCPGCDDRFEYRNLKFGRDPVEIETGEIVLSFTLTNTGERTGTEVPQLYIRDRVASVVRPVKELRAFGRVTLDPGQTAEVTFRVPVDMLNFTGPSGQRIVEPGVFDLQVGASSADIRLQTQVTVTGQTRVLGREWRMESSCDIKQKE